MSFNTALVGLQAATADLNVVGNNIANASTTGFKESRAEFGDVYANAILGTGADNIGGGAKLSKVSQQFGQGNITFTDNNLDLAIDGNGFFILSNPGGLSYTRAGIFGLDRDGFIVTNSGSRLQGQLAGGILSDLQIATANLDPRQTTGVTSNVNVDAGESVLAIFGTTINSLGASIGEAQVGIPNTVASSVSGVAASVFPFDFSQTQASTVTATQAPTFPFDFSTNTGTASALTATNAFVARNYTQNAGTPSSVQAASVFTGNDFQTNAGSASSITAAAAFSGVYSFSGTTVGSASTTTGSAVFSGGPFDFATNNETFNIVLGAESATVTLDSSVASAADLVTEINSALSNTLFSGRIEAVSGSDPLQLAEVGGNFTGNTIVVNGFSDTVIPLAGVLNLIGDGSDVGPAGIATNSGESFTLSLGAETATITLSSASVTSLPTLASAINNALTGTIFENRVQANTTSDPLVIEEIGSNFTGEPVVINNFSGTRLARVLNMVDGGGNNGSTGVETTESVSFDINFGGLEETINLTTNIVDTSALASVINAQLGTLTGEIEAVNNGGSLEIREVTDFEGTNLLIDNFTGAGATDFTSIVGIASGANNSSSDATNHNALFDLSFNGTTETVTLDANYTSSTTLANAINAKINGLFNNEIEAVAVSDRLVIREVGPTFRGTAVTVDNFTENSLTVADIGINLTDGVTSTSGDATAIRQATFDLTLAGATASNGQATITLDSNITNVAQLLNDINDDLQGSGIGIAAQDSGNGIIRFAATVPGEASTVTVDNFLANNATNATASLTGLANILQIPNPTSDNSGAELSSVTFDVSLSGSSIATENGSTSIKLQDNIVTIAQLVDDINDDLTASGIGVTAQEDPDNPGILQFVADTAGIASVLTVDNFDTSNLNVTAAQLDNVIQVATATLVPGELGVTNAYPAQAIDVVDPAGLVTTITTVANASAAATAAQFSQIPGVSASATTTATLSAANFTNPSGLMLVSLNGIDLTANSLATISTEINSLRTTTLPGLNASIDETSGDLTITSSTGADILLSVRGGGTADSLTIAGSDAVPVTLGFTAATETASAIGGSISFSLDEDFSFTNPVPANTGIFGTLTDADFTDFVIDAFDPLDQDTYNHATSANVFDSLGNSHVMSLFFVKEPFNPDQVASQANQWSLYVQVDGQDVGDPNTALAPPANSLATQARFTLNFNPNGTLNAVSTGTFLVSNWSPIDANGQPTGALGGLNVLAGGAIPVADPVSSSNFVIDLANSTQFGSDFSVNAISQDGFTTGRLSSLDLDDTGILFARYTNGQTQQIGQLALANFANVQGLSPTGETAWVETFESGDPVVGLPKTASLGAVTAGALEESNVDLAEQLVKLIIAQRNFQANSKTIQTADAITQTIINLR